jgi:hypothetical protein
MVQFANPVNGNVTKYDYDGEDRRVRKTTTTSGPVSTMKFPNNAMGQLAAEYSAHVNSAGGVQCRRWTIWGSTRLIPDQNGGVVERLECFPYGHAIPGTPAFGNRDQAADGS